MARPGERVGGRLLDDVATKQACHREPAGDSVGRGTAYGTFGELLQGVLFENGLDFLVTLPIAQFSTAIFHARADDDEVRVVPGPKAKSRLLAERILRAYAPRVGGLLQLSSTLPVGKGFASSSADLVATARAVADALGIVIDERTLEDFLRDIEPSDGVMYSGVVAYYHREVRLRERLGFLPPLLIVGHDEGGMVSTIEFNRRPKSLTDADKREYDDLLRTLTRAVREVDLPTLGAVATRSTEKNAKLLPRNHLADLKRICATAGGLGVVAAHSGTMLGILFADDEDGAAAARKARELCQQLPGTVSVHRSLGSA